PPRPAVAADRHAQGPARPGGHLPEGPGQGPRAPLPRLPGPGRRPPPLAPRRGPPGPPPRLGAIGAIGCRILGPASCRDQHRGRTSTPDESVTVEVPAGRRSITASERAKGRVASSIGARRRPAAGFGRRIPPRPPIGQRSEIDTR